MDMIGTLLHTALALRPTFRDEAGISAVGTVIALVAIVLIVVFALIAFTIPGDN